MSQTDLTDAALQISRRSVLEYLAESARTVMGFTVQQYSYDAGFFRFYGKGKPPTNGQYEPIVEAAGTRVILRDYDWQVAIHWHWADKSADMEVAAVGINGHPDMLKVEKILDQWNDDLTKRDVGGMDSIQAKVWEVETKYRSQPVYRPRPPKSVAKSKLAARD